MTDTTAIARRDEIGGLTVRFPPDRYNVLAPTVHLQGGLPAGTRLVVAEVHVDSGKAAREVYQIAGGALLVGKVALDRISNAAGISWLEERRTDPRTHPHYCEVMVRGRITDFDGCVREIVGSKTTDLREDAGGGIPGKDYAEISAKNSGPSRQLDEARKFIAEITASKARNRAIASALGIKRSYTAEELRRPFVVPRLALDPSHSQARDIVLAGLAGATAALYGRPEPVCVDVESVDTTPQVDDDTIAGGNSVAGVEAEGGLTPHPSATIEQRVTAAWSRAKALGASREQFVELARCTTGRASSSGLTADEVSRLEAAVESIGQSADSMPDF